MPVPATTEKVGRLSNLKLNPELFSPQEDELEFLKKQTSIDDVEKLKEHVISVQKSAWDVSRRILYDPQLFICPLVLGRELRMYPVIRIHKVRAQLSCNVR